MNNLDKQYTDLLQDILDNGTRKMDRTGTGTISVFGRQIRHDMKTGFPLLTTKKLHFKSIVVELLWFLRGDTNIKFLVDNDCNIWNGDAHKNYQLLMIGNEPEKILSMTDFIDKIKNDEKFANHWGELGPIYGAQWRSWKKNDSFIVEDDVWKNNEGWCSLKDFNKDELYIDQIQNLINDLKTNPDSRRLMVNAWNVGELDQMVLPPCHYGFQVYTRELKKLERINIAIEKKLTHETAHLTKDFDYQKWCDEQNIPTRAISLMWNQRSVDTFLGLPFNIASYGLLLEIIAKAVNMVPDELIGNLGDVHLYSNHTEQAKEQIGRDYTLEERLNMVSEEIQNEFSSGIVNLPNFPNTPVWSDDGKMSCLDDFGVPRRTREPFPLPKIIINENNQMRVGGGIFTYVNTDFTLENYQSHPAIKAPLSN